MNSIEGETIYSILYILKTLKFKKILNKSNEVLIHAVLWMSPENMAKWH